MNTKHTPGEWRASAMEMDPGAWRLLNRGKIDIVRRGQDVIAAVWCGDDKDGEEAANARLIAAAPELLEALQQAEEWLTGWASAEPYLSVIRAAIAKATGAP